MSEKDDRDAAFYEAPENRKLEGPGRKRASAGKRLENHVPVRFEASVIDQVKAFAFEDGMTVSAWIRSLVEQQVRWRAAKGNKTGADPRLRLTVRVESIHQADVVPTSTSRMDLAEATG